LAGDAEIHFIPAKPSPPDPRKSRKKKQLHRLRQKRVAQFPRGHFNRDALLCGVRFHLAAPRVKRQSQFRRGPTHETFIGITVTTAQPVIEMRH
jgi:hypothetical protein